MKRIEEDKKYLIEHDDSGIKAKEDKAFSLSAISDKIKHLFG